MHNDENAVVVHFLLHIVEKEGNKRYHSFKLLETLSATAGEEVREALGEVLE